jgi:hypothetical protein
VSSKEKLMVKTLYKYSMQGRGVGEPGISCKKPSNNINICSIFEADIPMLRIQDESKHECRPTHYGSMKDID